MDCDFGKRNVSVVICDTCSLNINQGKIIVLVGGWLERSLDYEFTIYVRFTSPWQIQNDGTMSE
jgi:hypothetical protein